MVASLVLLPFVLLVPLSEPLQPACTIEAVQTATAETPILASFAVRIDAYMRVHNDVERAIAPQRMYDDPEELYATLAAMRSGIRLARLNRGERIFTNDVGALIRTRLAARLVECGQTVEEILAFVTEEPPTRVRPPTVHEPFPWEVGAAMPVSLLPVLPVLPDELQYRFVGRDLVLIDVHADLVVDILRFALPAPSVSDDES